MTDSEAIDIVLAERQNAARFRRERDEARSVVWLFAKLLAEATDQDAELHVEAGVESVRLGLTPTRNDWPKDDKP